MIDEELPLEGRVILVTRPAGRSGGLRAALEKLGARVELRPTIAFEPPADGRAVASAIGGLDRFDWLLFTSPTGVRFFSDLAQPAARASAGRRPRVGAIGRGTANALVERGWAVDVVATASHSEGLAAAIRKEVGAEERLLLVRPEVARSVVERTLEGLGVRVESVAFYRNVPAPGVADVAADVGRGRFDVVVFTSPSTLQRLLDSAASSGIEVKPALRRAAIVAIGEVTAAAVRRANLRVNAVATEPSEEGIVEAIVGLFGDP